MKPTAKKNFKLTGAYTSSVAAYGEPPKGFRFLNLGETTEPDTDYFLFCGTEWRKESSHIAVKTYHVPMIRRLPEDAPVAESAPPKYTGPEVSFQDSLSMGIAKAGEAPKGWDYLKVRDLIVSTDFVLFKDRWVPVGAHHKYVIGNELEAGFWPVIRRADPKPAAPKVTMKDLLARIEALEKKVGGAKVTLTLGD